MFDWDEFMYGDGSGRPIGGLLSPAIKREPPHPGVVTRQQRRAAERRARKAGRVPTAPGGGSKIGGAAGL